MAKKRKQVSGSPRNGRGNLLLISYFFPPTAGGGVFRPLAMVKHLAALGWNITVLTATTPRHYPKDPALEKQIPDSVEVIRLPVVWEGSLFRRALGKIKLDWIPRHLITPDERIFWADRATSRAKKIMKEGSFDCLYTTGPPFSVQMTGLWLKRQVAIPWVAEFRDPWTLAPFQELLNAHQRRMAKEAEFDLVELADATVMVTPTFTKMMKEKYPEGEKRIHCVENGFEADDFRIDAGEKRNETFTVVASGTVFGKYNLDDFVAGLESLKESSPEIFKRLSVKFQGLPDYRMNRRLLESGLHKRCDSLGFVPHAENVKDLIAADLLVLALGDVRNAGGHIPSRVYEYLASKTPILAVCPKGDLRELLKEFPQVTIVEPGQVENVCYALLKFFNKWETREETPEPDREVLRGLTRKVRAVEMDAIISGVSGISKGAG